MDTVKIIGPALAAALADPESSNSDLLTAQYADSANLKPERADHLAEAKVWAEQAKEGLSYANEFAQTHALISIAASLERLASCVSDFEATAHYFRTQPHG